RMISATWMMFMLSGTLTGSVVMISRIDWGIWVPPPGLFVGPYHPREAANLRWVRRPRRGEGTNGETRTSRGGHRRLLPSAGRSPAACGLCRDSPPVAPPARLGGGGDPRRESLPGGEAAPLTRIGAANRPLPRPNGTGAGASPPAPP